MINPIENRNESYRNLPAKTRRQETLEMIKSLGQCTPQQTMEYWRDKRPTNEVNSRFTELRDRGLITPIYNLENSRSGKKNVCYRASTEQEINEYSIDAGVRWTDRIKELETDHNIKNENGEGLSDQTKIDIRNKIKKHNKDINNLGKI